MHWIQVGPVGLAFHETKNFLNTALGDGKLVFDCSDGRAAAEIVEAAVRLWEQERSWYRHSGKHPRN